MNPILKKTQSAVLAKADKRLRPVIGKIVDAGHKVMFSEKTRQMALAQFRQGANPEAVGAGIAKLMGILFNQSKNTIPMEAGIPAAVILTCDALQFLEDAGAAKVTNDLLAQSVKAMASALLQMLGVTPEKLQSMMGQQAAQPAAQQPAQPAQPAPPAGGIVQGAMQ